MKVPERYRVLNGEMGSTADFGANGLFIIPHQMIDKYEYVCICGDGNGWDHVSVSIRSTVRKVERCPTREEMCFIKSLFWDDDEIVIEYHPAKSDCISNHPFVLHPWKPQGIELPTPDPLMVGINKK